MKTLVFSFNLKYLNDLKFIEVLVSNGYKMLNKKISVNFNGSKGYLDNIEICCEGKQEFGINRLIYPEIITKKGTLKRKMVNVWHEENYGISLELSGGVKYHE